MGIGCCGGKLFRMAKIGEKEMLRGGGFKFDAGGKEENLVPKGRLARLA